MHICIVQSLRKIHLFFLTVCFWQKNPSGNLSSYKTATYSSVPFCVLFHIPGLDQAALRWETCKEGPRTVGKDAISSLFCGLRWSHRWNECELQQLDYSCVAILRTLPGACGCLNAFLHILQHELQAALFFLITRTQKLPEDSSWNSVWFVFSPGGVFHGHCLPSSLLHGSLFMDAGRGASPVEQSGSGQHEWRQENEVLLCDRLGYLQNPLLWPLRKTCQFLASKSFNRGASGMFGLIQYESRVSLLCRGFLTFYVSNCQS